MNCPDCTQGWPVYRAGCAGCEKRATTQGPSLIDTPTRKHKTWAEREQAARDRVKPEPVDFARVPPSQWAMHDRLEGWARWCDNRPVAATAPGFSLYRSSEARRAYGGDSGVPVDKMDAQRVAKGVAALPEKHREAVIWHYLRRGRDAKARAQALGKSLQGLADLVADGRQMLINKGI